MCALLYQLQRTEFCASLVLASFATRCRKMIKLPSYSVFACWYVTWPGDLDLLTLQLSYMAGHVANPATKFEDPKTIRSWVTSYNGSHWLPLKMRTRPLRVRRITWPVSRGWKTITFWNPRPRFACSLYHFGGSTMNIIKVISENNARPVLKNVWDSAHARNHVICLMWPKCLNAVVLADVDLPYWTSIVEHIAAFTAIFSNICIAQAQKRLFMNCRCKFRHRRSIRRPRFLVRVQNFGDLADVFRWFLHFIFWMSAIFLLPVCLTYWPRKYITRVDPHVDNSHQVWSPYADPFLSYEW